MKNPPFPRNLQRLRKASFPHQGFALIVTLVMMVLLMILALGLLNLSTISLRKSGVSTAAATARNNARLAMMLALGELQKHAGQDQRITATADIASGDATGLPIPDGKAPTNNTSVNDLPKGLSAVQPGSRYWTGVWRKNSEQGIPEPQIFKRTPSPEFQQWLISGNEYLAGTSINSPASSGFALNGDGSVPDKKTLVVLAGRNTIGAPSSETLSRYVSAPLVAISRKGSETTGRYAWWIGDEGVKSKINLSPKGSTSSVATYQTLSPQRSGWETVTGFSNFPTPASPNSQVSLVVTLPEAELLDPMLGQGSPSPLGKAFHSATADSFGVISDTLNGGLRLDLSAYLSKSFPTTPVPNAANPPAAGRNIIPTNVAGSIQGPKWDRLREFADMFKSLSNGKLVVKAATTNTEAAISPAIVDLRVIMGAKIVPAATDAYKVYPCAKVAISLANPYPYPITWTSPLELEFKSDTPAGNAPSRIWELNLSQPAFLPRGDGNGNPTDSALLSRAIFRIPSDEIPPGEARAYTMGGTLLRPANDMNQVSVDLRAFAGSDSQNFSNSLQMIYDAVYPVAPGASLPAMDVRESWTTSLLTAELRTGGSSSNPPILRRIERFELDNGYFFPTRRVVSAADAKTFIEPFPLQLYSFQISQPGADYAILLPDPSSMGIRSSTMRTFADFNLQATRFRKPITSYNPPPYFMESTSDKASLPFISPGGDTGLAFTKNLAITPMAWGRSSVGSTKRTILFSPPETLISLGQFQHADLTADDKYVSVGHQPGNAFGNSYATPFVKRNFAIQNRKDYTIVGNNNRTLATSDSTNYYDVSYLLNASIWDGCFLSSIPASGAAEPLNERIVKIAGDDTSPDLRDGLRSASRLLINGSFNVNSTDKDAWKAMLAGTRFLKHPADAASVSVDAMFPRSLEQKSSSKTVPTGTDDDSFSGYRRLTNDQIDALAEEITKQVRLRGPFVSISHFVNRALADITRSKALTRSGALQSALDIAAININPEGTKKSFSGVSLSDEALNLQADGNAPRADMTGGRPTVLNDEPDPVWAPQSRDLNPGAIAGILADRQMLTDPTYKTEQGFRSTGIPGWVTQADVLQAIGPVISSRSDTFRIRSYGEAVDPVTGQTTARAWCEAVVQRTPLYIDGSNVPTDRGIGVSSLNQFFGRSYQIVSFRWLSPDEI